MWMWQDSPNVLTNRGDIELFQPEDYLKAMVHKVVTTRFRPIHLNNLQNKFEVWFNMLGS